MAQDICRDHADNAALSRSRSDIDDYSHRSDSKARSKSGSGFCVVVAAFGGAFAAFAEDHRNIASPGNAFTASRRVMDSDREVPAGPAPTERRPGSVSEQRSIEICHGVNAARCNDSNGPRSHSYFIGVVPLAIFCWRVARKISAPMPAASSGICPKTPDEGSLEFSERLGSSDSLHTVQLDALGFGEFVLEAGHSNVLQFRVSSSGLEFEDWSIDSLSHL